MEIKYEIKNETDSTPVAEVQKKKNAKARVKQNNVMKIFSIPLCAYCVHILTTSLI